MPRFDIKRQDIKLPHLNYVVKVRLFEKVPDDLGLSPGTQAWVDRTDRRHSVVNLRKNAQPGTVAHELMHVIQHIVRIRTMDFLSEEEHLAYIMQYLLGRILGYEWASPAQ